MVKLLSAFFCLLLVLLVVSSTIAPAYTQIVHEDPAYINPSNDITLEAQINNIIDFMGVQLESLTISLKEGNYTNAEESYAYFNDSVDVYYDLLQRMNFSDSMYEKIALNFNYTRDELRQFVQNSETFTESLELYNQSVSTGNNTGINASSAKAKSSYDQLSAAYDRLRANTTTIENILTDNNIDTAQFESSMNHINNYMVDLNAKYNGPGATNVSDFRLNIEPAVPSLGDSVQITTTLMGTNGASFSGATVNVYFNNIVIGSYVINNEGIGTMSYVIPVDTNSDTIYVHAEAIPKDRNMSRAYSNVILLNIPDKKTLLTFIPDKSTISYTDPVCFTGSLNAIDGMPAPHKNITIYMNNKILGNASTDTNGTYSFTYNVTPGTMVGRSTFYAKYNGKPGNVFLSSVSTSHTLDIIPKLTVLTLDGGMHFRVGDIGRVKGTLKTDDNVPVKGTGVLVYVDGAYAGNGTTDKSGAYNIIIRISGNATMGTHELYTAFQPGTNSSLHNSTSDRQSVLFENSIETLTIDDLPFIVFNGDMLYVNGTLVTDSGLPISDRKYNVTASMINLGIATTDKNGKFYSSYQINGNDTIGYYTISVDELSDEGIPPVNRYTGHLVLIPFDKFPSMGASTLMVIIVIAVTVFIIRSRRIIRMPEQVIVGSTAEPIAIPDTASLQPPAPVETVTPKDIAVKPGLPAPFTAAPMRMPPADEKMTFEQPLEQKMLPSFNMDAEIMSIRSAIREGNLKEAMASIYVASKNVALIHHMDVPDSMTHKEFYFSVTEKYPILTKPLLHILNPYEIVTFAGRAVGEDEVNRAVSGLKEFYSEFEDEVTGD